MRPPLPEKVNISKEIMMMTIYLAAIVLIICGIVAFVGQKTEVYGDSMNDTLQNGDQLWLSKSSFKKDGPNRFDIIVFESDAQETHLIKRVIGLPGETVYIDPHGNIYINDELLIEDYGKEHITEDNIGIAKDGITLGSDEYFVLGDNRNDSLDSRFIEIGNVKKEAIVGKVKIRVFPFKSFGFVK